MSGENTTTMDMVLKGVDVKNWVKKLGPPEEDWGKQEATKWMFGYSTEWITKVISAGMKVTQPHRVRMTDPEEGKAGLGQCEMEWRFPVEGLGQVSVMIDRNYILGKRKFGGTRQGLRKRRAVRQEVEESLEKEIEELETREEAERSAEQARKWKEGEGSRG
jgi:hypothetical protein